MTKEEFTKILKEYKYSDHMVDALWDSRPTDDLDPQNIRAVAEEMVKGPNGRLYMEIGNDSKAS